MWRLWSLPECCSILGGLLVKSSPHSSWNCSLPNVGLVKILGRAFRDLFKNDENKAFDKEDTSKGEHCNKCDENFWTGWKSKKHIDGRHLLGDVVQLNMLLFLSSTLNCNLFHRLSHSHWETFAVIMTLQWVETVS